MRYRYRSLPTVLDRLDRRGRNGSYGHKSPPIFLQTQRDVDRAGPRIIMLAPDIAGSTMVGQMPGLAIAALLQAAAMDACAHPRLAPPEPRWSRRGEYAVDGELDDVGEATATRPERALREPRFGRRHQVIDAEYVTKETPRQPPPNRDAAPKRPALQSYLPDKGVRCVVKLEHYRDLIAPQLAHPERLRDSHRIPCVVQVYATADCRPIDEQSRAELGELGKRLRVLTHADARRMHLDPALVANDAATPGASAASYFDLQVVADPSADPAASDSPQPNKAAAPSPARLRTTIPQKFIKPWTFVIGRDEAAFDCDAASNRFSLRRVALQLKSSLFSKRARQRWAALLVGRDVDSQLWEIPPPKGAVRHPEVRQWLMRALRIGGYDVGTMLHEWEIYWRRRGCI